MATSGLEAKEEAGAVETPMPGCQTWLRGSWTLTNTVAFSESSGGTLAQIAAAQPSVGCTATLGALSLPGILEKLIRSVVVSTAGRGVGRTQGAAASRSSAPCAPTGWAATRDVRDAG